MDASMNAMTVIIVDEASYNPIRLPIAFKFVASITLRFQYGVERFDMSVLIRRLGRYALVNNFKLFTGLCKSVADKLRSIVGSYDRSVHFVKELALHQRLLCDLNQILGSAGQTMVIRYNRTVKHVDNAHQEEKALFAFNPAIFDIRFPQLIRTGNDSVIRQPFGVLNFELPLRPQYVHQLAQPIYFLLVNHKSTLTP